MSPILGGIGGVSVRGFGHFPNLYFSSFDSIATTTLTGSASSITFSSIPATYEHLQVRAIMRLGGSDYLTTTFNTGTAVNNRHRINGDGSTMSAGGGSGTGQDFGPYPTNSNAANIFGVLILDILDYKNTNKFKTYRFFNGFELNGSGQIYLQSTTAATTSAITSIEFATYSGTGFVANTQFALYGLKGA